MDVDYAPTEEEKEPPSPAKPGPTDFYIPPPDPLSADVFAPLIPPIAIGVVAFCLVGLVIWAGQKMTHAAEGNGYTRAISREMSAPPPDPVTTYAGPDLATKMGSPTMPRPQPLEKSLLTGPFLGDERRSAAHAALTPVHQMLALLRKFDGPLLWGAAPTAGVGGPVLTSPANGVAPLTVPFPNTLSAGGEATRAATFQDNPTGTAASIQEQAVTVDHIHSRAESLATQVDLYLPPSQYPEPLQPGVKTVVGEFHAYLKDADLAATADSPGRALLRDRASRRLAHADQVLQYMDGVISGTTDPNVTPLP